VNDADTFVLARARAGDREAFRTLVEQHSRGVFRAAYRITWNEQDAEDVVQEAFLKAYTQLPRFEARAQFGSWVHRIAINCAIDLVRRRTRHMDTEDAEPMLAQAPSPSPGPDREAEGRELRDRIGDAMASLSPLERAAFTLRHVEQYPVAEISRALGQSPVATRHSIFRAVAKMRRALAPVRTSV
jgi:RNA polymerase sigma-70 factor, ECF subfamily